MYQVRVVRNTVYETLSDMECHYKKSMKAMRDELNSWKFRHLTVFVKLTVIKTLCVPKFTHIATVIPNLCLTKIQEIERCWEEYINTNSCRSVDQMPRYNYKRENGLGMLRISDFWQSVGLSGLRRLPYTKATWGKLHCELWVVHTIID